MAEDETIGGRVSATDPATADEAAGAEARAGDDGPIVVSPSVYRRLMSGLPGFIAAMLCCFVVVGLVLLITPRRNENAMPRIDYQGDLTGLQAVAPYQVQAPSGLPGTWYPTSSRLSGKAGGPVSWHLGFNTPDKEYAALEESNESGGHGGFVDRMTSQGRPDGTIRVAGADWSKAFRADKKQRSLVRGLPGVTLVVTGTASYEELAVLAGSLHPLPKPAPDRT